MKRGKSCGALLDICAVVEAEAGLAEEEGEAVTEGGVLDPRQKALCSDWTEASPVLTVLGSVQGIEGSLYPDMSDRWRRQSRNYEQQSQVKRKPALCFWWTLDHLFHIQSFFCWILFELSQNTLNVYIFLQILQKVKRCVCVFKGVQRFVNALCYLVYC